MSIEKVRASIDSKKLNDVSVSSLDLKNLSADRSGWLDRLLVSIRGEKQVVHVLIFILVVIASNILDLTLELISHLKDFIVDFWALHTASRVNDGLQPLEKVGCAHLSLNVLSLCHSNQIGRDRVDSKHPILLGVRLLLFSELVVALRLVRGSIAAHCITGSTAVVHRRDGRIHVLCIPCGLALGHVLVVLFVRGNSLTEPLVGDNVLH